VHFYRPKYWCCAARGGVRVGRFVLRRQGEPERVAGTGGVAGGVQPLADLGHLLLLWRARQERPVSMFLSYFYAVGDEHSTSFTNVGLSHILGYLTFLQNKISSRKIFCEFLFAKESAIRSVR
jgi:hypothetical protein